MNSGWSQFSLIFLFAVGLIGTLLRSVAFIELPLPYTNFVHAHSHVAFQGWLYPLLLLFLTNIFLDESQIKKGRYSLQFILTVGVVTGVLISFVVQGYGLFSILFSTFFQLLNYWFIYSFLRDTKGYNRSLPQYISLKFVRTGLWFGLITTLFPYGIGFVAAKGLSGSEVYHSLIYTFMHFQYNGWYLFVVLGLFYNFLSLNGISFDYSITTKFYWFMMVAVVPAISLSLMGMSYASSIELIAYFSVILIFIGLYYFLVGLPRNLFSQLSAKNIWFKVFFYMFLCAFVLKTILQCISVFDVFRAYAFLNKSIILAYLHLSMIGVLSFWFVALMIAINWLRVNVWLKLGSVFLVFGFFVTELMLVLNGFNVYFDSYSLIIGSVAMLTGIGFLIFAKNSSPRSVS